MKRDIVTSAIGIVVLTAAARDRLSAAVTGVSQVAFPGNANGQKVYVHGQLVGSKIIGQSLRDPGGQERQAAAHQHQGTAARPGSAVLPEPAVGHRRAVRRRRSPYNAAASAFSNLGPNNTATEQAIAANIAAI